MHQESGQFLAKASAHLHHVHDGTPAGAVLWPAPGVQVVWLVDTMSLTMVMLVIYSVVLVVQGFGDMCWIVLVVAVGILEYTCHCGCRCRCCHVVVAVILVDSSLPVIINDCQCFHI